MNSRVVAAVLLGLWSVASFGQAQCHLWRQLAGGAPYQTWEASPVAAAQHTCDYIMANIFGIEACDGITITGWAGVPYETAATFTYVRHGTDGSSETFGGALEHMYGDCPPPDPCECPGAGSAAGCGDTFTSSADPGANGYCNPVTHCKMEVTSSMGGLFTVSHTEEECTPGAQPPDDDDLDEGETCETTTAGNELCLSNAGENCGYLNGNFICLPNINDDGCDVFADGSRLCGSGAPTPPVPDNGEPGVPADPDDQIDTGDGDTYNYYDVDTVGGSARPPGDGGDNPFDGDDGDGSDGLTQPGDGEGVGEGECPEGATCDGSLPDAGEFEEVCTFGACAQEFLSRVQAAPLVAGVLGVGAGFPAGACPNWTLEAFGEDYLLSAPMCDIWENVSPLLSAIFLVIWAWVATRIVLSA